MFLCQLIFYNIPVNNPRCRYTIRHSHFIFFSFFISFKATIHFKFNEITSTKALWWRKKNIYIHNSISYINSNHQMHTSTRFQKPYFIRHFGLPKRSSIGLSRAAIILRTSFFRPLFPKSFSSRCFYVSSKNPGELCPVCQVIEVPLKCFRPGIQSHWNLVPVDHLQIL